METATFFKRARECKFFRAALLDLAAELPATDTELDELLAGAVAKRENEAFTNMLLGALGAGRRIDAKQLVEGAALVPDPGYLAAAAMHVSGNVAAALIDAVTGGKMGIEREATALLLAGIWCKDRAKEPVPAALISQARTLARRASASFLPRPAHDNPLAHLSLVALANLIRDESLLSVLKLDCFVESDPYLQFFTQDLIDTVKDSALGLVPERPGPVTHSGFTLRRAVARVGRNDPCPCGSGKKYKKCCIEKDHERLQESSSAAGLTTEELREQKELFLTKDELLGMRSYELARLDPAKVADSLKPLLINRLHAYDENDTVVGLFEKIGVSEELEGHWQDAIHNVSIARRRDLLVRLLKLRGGPDKRIETLPLGARLLMLEESANPELELMEKAALEALKTGEDDSVLELAHFLLESRYPSLGIHVARSLLPTTHFFSVDVLFDSVLEARDKLNLSPVDPYQRIIDERFKESVDAHRDSAALKGALHNLESKDRELSKLRTQMADFQSELDRKEREIQRSATAKPSQTETPQSPGDATLLAELRHRAATLKEELKQRHNERNHLRRDLQSALGELEAMRQKAAEPRDSAGDEAERTEEHFFLEEESLGLQPVRILEFPKKFLASIEPLPPTTVRNAMALLGRLAAGDETAFTGIKRLKANREIHRQRMGSDHRLLFRLHSDRLEVVALINRRDLERKIKSLS